ncbi:MAG: hypothetical protein IKC73_04805 [Clostridia bacterium]|nr:hypothetical protein [Clostridia bacterium]
MKKNYKEAPRAVDQQKEKATVWLFLEAKSSPRDYAAGPSRRRGPRGGKIVQVKAHRRKQGAGVLNVREQAKTPRRGVLVKRYPKDREK